MTDRKCPICLTHGSDASKDWFDHFRCDVCRGVYIDSRLVRAPTTLDNWPDLLGAARELQEQFSWLPTIRFDGTVTCADADGRDHQITRFPSSISERAHRLLATLVKRTDFFGQVISVTGNDYPLAYVASPEAFFPYIAFLEKRDLINNVSHDSDGTHLAVTASGFDAVSESELLPELTVFLSSTCYDLRDCRFELCHHLQGLGCLLRVSDDPLQFDVSPTNDSIQSCLLNVARSDVVLCIIDQRYGPPLPDGEFAGISATHAEVRFARSKNIPVFFFIRSDAFTEWSMLKRDASARTAWVEPKDEARRRLWVDFVSEFAAIPDKEGISNWFDQYTSIVDLKRIVTARMHAFRHGRM